jgi:predicted nucleic acid-binding protein
MTTILLDAGPLVAYLNSKDRWHSWAVAQFKNLRPPLLTCEAVLAEACFLTSRNRGHPADVLALLNRKVFQNAIDAQAECAALE